MRLMPGKNDFATMCPDLMKEWDFMKNTVKPTRCSVYSHKRVWWRCSKGHSWLAPIYKRTHRKTGCPICQRKAHIEHYCYSNVRIQNSLQTKYPQLAQEWHPIKNGLLTPADVNYHSNRMVWWQCEQGHEWQACIHSRIAGTGCPYCSKQKPIPNVTDLQTVAPRIAAEWHPTKNGDLTPDKVSYRSHRIVYWQCSQGHEWQAEVRNRTKYKHSECPECKRIRREQRKDGKEC